MTAIRSFPNAPLAQRSRPTVVTQLLAWADGAWQALQSVGQRRAAWELEVLADRRALTDPVLARELRSAAEDCRRSAEHAPTRLERSSS